MKRKKRLFVLLILILIIFAGVGYIFTQNKIPFKKTAVIGEEIDTYKGVAVYYNGADYSKSHGENYSRDGYLYGQKWQCVEYIKRFYYEVKGHKMPDVYGNAKDFFNPQLYQGQINKARGLVQYRNGDAVKPAPDDLIVFNDTTFGHVAIVTEVGEDYLQVIQQNIQGKTRERYKLEIRGDKYFVTNPRVPAGWLRKI